VVVVDGNNVEPSKQAALRGGEQRLRPTVPVRILVELLLELPVGLEHVLEAGAFAVG